MYKLFIIVIYSSCCFCKNQNLHALLRANIYDFILPKGITLNLQECKIKIINK